MMEAYAKANDIIPIGQIRHIGWVPPSDEWIKVNIDSSYFQSSNATSCCGILRNHLGEGTLSQLFVRSLVIVA